MKPILVVYGTWDGHTTKVAEYIGALAAQGGWDVNMRLCKELPAHLDLSAYSGVIVAAPVHNGRHESSVVAFAQRYRMALRSIPTAFVSLGVVPMLPRFVRRPASAQVIAKFVKETGWQPSKTLTLSGAIMYRTYPARQRAVWCFFMALLRGPTDTARDHDLTDWASLRQFIREFLSALSRPG